MEITQITEELNQMWKEPQNPARGQNSHKLRLRLENSRRDPRMQTGETGYHLKIVYLHDLHNIFTSKESCAFAGACATSREKKGSQKAKAQKQGVLNTRATTGKD